MNKKCLGCGSLLQSEKENGLGYVPKNKYDDALYCERCFKINNYNLKVYTELDNINEYIIKTVNNANKFVFFLIDYLNLNEKPIDMYKMIKGNKALIIPNTPPI